MLAPLSLETHPCCDDVTMLRMAYTSDWSMFESASAATCVVVLAHVVGQFAYSVIREQYIL